MDNVHFLSGLIPFLFYLNMSAGLVAAYFLLRNVLNEKKPVVGAAGEFSKRNLVIMASLLVIGGTAAFFQKRYKPETSTAAAFSPVNTAGNTATAAAAETKAKPAPTAVIDMGAKIIHYISTSDSADFDKLILPLPEIMEQDYPGARQSAYVNGVSAIKAKFAEMSSLIKKYNIDFSKAVFVSGNSMQPNINSVLNLLYVFKAGGASFELDGDVMVTKDGGVFIDIIDPRSFEIKGLTEEDLSTKLIPVNSENSVAGIYSSIDNNGQYLEVDSNGLFFQFRREGERPANFALWKIASDKIALYLPSQDVIWKEFTQEGGNENDPASFKKVIGKILLSHKAAIFANEKSAHEDLPVYQDVIVWGDKKFIKRK